MSKNNTVFTGTNKSFWDRNRRSGGYLLRKRSSQIAVSVIRGLLLFGLCFMIIQPLLTRFSMGLMVEKDLYDSTVILLPRNVTLDNYRIVAELTDLKNIGGAWTFNALLNTLWVSLVISLFTIVSTTLVAYGFARYEFPLKKFWFGCVVALIIIPPQTIQSALYMNFANFDILRIFTLFGVNAEGLSFGQRLLSVVDGTGTGLIALLTGKTLNLRANISAYVIMSMTCMGLKNGLYIYMMRHDHRQLLPVQLRVAVDGYFLYPFVPAHDFHLYLFQPDVVHGDAHGALLLRGPERGRGGTQRPAAAADFHRGADLLHPAGDSLYFHAAHLHRKPGHVRQQGIRQIAFRMYKTEKNLANLCRMPYNENGLGNIHRNCAGTVAACIEIKKEVFSL